MNKRFLTTAFIATLLTYMTFIACNQNKSSEDTKTEEVNVKSSNDKIKELTWEQMVLEIQKGQYTSMSQEHSKMLKLISKDGTIYEALQPEIDAYLKVLESCDNCPKVPIATE